MKQFLKNALYTILILLLILVMVFYLVLTTETGLRLAINIAPRLVTGLKIKSGQGTLGKSFELDQVEYNTPNYRIKLKRIGIDWSPFRWFGKTGLVKKLEVKQLDVYLLPPDPKAESEVSRQAKINWLRQNYFANVDIEELNIYYDDELKGKIDRITSVLNPDGTYQINMQFAEGRLYGNAYLHFGKDLEWKMSLTGENINSEALWKGLNAKLNFNVQSTGVWGDKKKEASFVLSDLQGTLQGYPLQGNAAFDYKNDLLLIRRMNIQVANSKIDVEGTAGDKWDLRWDIAIQNLNQFYDKARGQFFSQGTLSGRQDKPIISGAFTAQNVVVPGLRIGSAQGLVKSPMRVDATAEIDATLTNVRTFEQSFDRVRLDVFLRRYANTLQIVGDVIIDTDMRAQLNIGLPNFFKNYQSQISGTVDFALAKLPRIKVSKYVKNLTGTVDGRIRLSGRLQEPNMAGTIHYQGGFSVPAAGIRINNIDVQGTLQNDRPIQLQGQFQLGGTGSIRGTVNPFSQELTYNLAIRGNNLQVVNLREYKITASPDLVVRSAGKAPQVSGRIFVPRALIQPDSFETVVTFPAEVVFVGRPRKENYATNISLRVRLVLGREIYVAYKDVRANLAGSIFVFQVPGGLPTANGELRITQGVYHAYDRTFTISGGRFIYTGNLLVNPGLSIRAIRSVDPCTPSLFGIRLNAGPDVAVGLSIQGTLEDPEVSLFSSPPLPQDDVLSYLVFGQPRAQVGAGSVISTLGSAASGFGGDGSPSDLSGPVNWLSGIFKMGLFGSGQILSLDFPLSEHLTLRTESSFNDVGADLLYVYEVKSCRHRLPEMFE